MKTRFLAGLIGSGLVFAPMVSAAEAKKHPTMSEDMRQAIAFERAKDRADARQARLEKIHPSVSYTDANRNADRSIDESQGRIVRDPGKPATKKNK
ncbi:MAG: hypothetical protein LAQ69_36870 [Acidobacteriia bacterium]|nr:hypothetical protein [Terriglobia bacterium]